MKKIFLFMFVFCNVIFLSNTFEYLIQVNESKIGTSTVEINEMNFFEKTITKLQIGGTKVKYDSYTQYDESWHFKEYKLDIYVNDNKQGTLISKYANGFIESTFNGMNLKKFEVKDPVILDNNIIGHFCSLNKLRKGKITIFIPSLLLSPTTIKYAIINSQINKDNKVINLKMLGSTLNIYFDNNILKLVFDVTKKVKIFLNKNTIIENKEKEVTFKSNGFELCGSIIFPKNLSKKNPAIILVHGSGPNDRDESMPVNGSIYKPFLEIAKGLAKKGFIVFRYDKRSYTMIKQKVRNFDNLSVKDFVNDARAGIDFLKKVKGVDKDSIFVLGHSQGASFIPLIVKDKKVKGAIAISPALLDIFDQMEYQLKYQLNYIEKLNKNNKYEKTILTIKKYLKEVEEANEKYKHHTLQKDDIILGQKAKIFMEWNDLQPLPIKDLSGIKIPLLILNGTKDLKTPKELLEKNIDKLRKNKNISINYLENTTHEMMNIKTLKFNKIIIDDIVFWISKLNEVN